MKALQEIDRVINSSSDLEISLEIVLSKILQLLKPDAIDILLTNPITHNMDFKAGYGFSSGNIKKNYLIIGTGLPAQAILERKTIYKKNLNNERLNLIRDFLVNEENFSTYFCAPMITKGNVIGVIELFFHEIFDPSEEWGEFFQTLANQTAIAVNNAQLFIKAQQTNIELINSINATIEGWVNTLDLRDKETEGHSQRVTSMAIKLAQLLNISGNELTNIQRGSLLHDIGKVGVPETLLSKPGKLTPPEFEEIKKHTIIGERLCRPVGFLQGALPVIRHHHERFVYISQGFQSAFLSDKQI